jgi:hypothetical protein
MPYLIWMQPNREHTTRGRHVRRCRVTVIGGQQPRRPIVPIALDADDIGGVVTGEDGPEAGVWVIAETRELGTGLIRIVVTDDQGRYVLPDLPKAGYDVFVRGYGLLDSKRVPGRPGQRLDFSVAEAGEREAAAVFPASYWLSLIRVPPTGPIHPADLTRALKSCMTCHQLGSLATRELSAAIGAHLQAWDERVKRGPSGALMAEQFARLRGQRTMLSEWTERIAAGIYPIEGPPRPHGPERNVVITQWIWGDETTLADGEAASEPRDAGVNPNGRVYGASRFHDALLWVDPAAHAAGEVTIPTSVPLPPGTPSPSFGGTPIWRSAAEPRGAAIDQGNRVWLSARHRANDDQPPFCGSSTNRFARFFPLATGTRQVSIYEPGTNRFTQIDTCFTAEGSDPDAGGRRFFGAGDIIGWIDARTLAAQPASQPVNHEAVQGWCPLVVDANGDGVINSPWTEPRESADASKDRRIQFDCGRPVVAPDGAVWCSAAGAPDDRILRLELGANPPESCKAEVFEVPRWRDVSGARGLDVDSTGVVWVSMAATDHLARFDRRKCRTLNGPRATGQHCDEGWSFYPIPGPPFTIASPTAGADAVLRGAHSARTTDLMDGTTVDRFDVLGLNGGQDVPMTRLVNGDAVLAFMPGSGDFVALRVPYPLGFFARTLHARIDDPAGGWKGRGLWSSYGSWAGWHVEGGGGVRSRVVKFQMRPDPLAK